MVGSWFKPNASPRLRLARHVEVLKNKRPSIFLYLLDMMYSEKHVTS